MRLRTFTAHDMPAAMAMVRQELGEHAIILNSSHKKNNGPVSITAAVDPEEETTTPAQPKTSDDLTFSSNNEQSNQLRHDMQEVLRFHNVPELFLSKIMNHATDKEMAAFQAMQHISSSKDTTNLLRMSIEKLLDNYFSYTPLDFNKPTARLMLVGPPGIGKTLTIAKIAAKLVMSDKKELQKLRVITTDNKRAGGFEQLQSLTNIMGIELQAANDPLELADLLKNTPKDSRVLVDTAGCNPYNSDEMEELKNYANIDNALEPVMVLPAGGDSMEAIDIIESFSQLPVERLLITRTDTAKRFGGILAAAASHRLAFCHSSGSSSVIDSLTPLSSTGLAKLLLTHKKPMH